MTISLRNFLLSWRQLIGLMIVIVVVAIFESLGALVIRSYSVQAVGVMCTVTSIDSSYDRSFLVAQLDCNGLKSRARDARFIAAHLKQKDAPVICDLYGGIGYAECKVKNT